MTTPACRALFVHRRPLRAALKRAWARRLPTRSWGAARSVRGVAALGRARFGLAKRARFAGFYHRRRRSFTLRALFRHTWTGNVCRVFFLAKSASAYRRVKEHLELGGISLQPTFFSAARRWASPALSPASSATLPGSVLALYSDSVAGALRAAAWLDHPGVVCVGFGICGRLLTPQRLGAVLSSVGAPRPGLGAALRNAGARPALGVGGAVGGPVRAPLRLAAHAAARAVPGG